MKKHYLFTLFFNLLLFCGLVLNASGQYSLEDHWPNLKFKLPVGMYTPPDSSNRIFVLEQAGKIVVFKDSGVVTLADTSAFLNLAGKVSTGISPGNEYGLLGMAFHPNFKSNGYVIVSYTRSSPLTSYISRFKLDPANVNKLDLNSEKVIIKLPQPYSNHNGGSVIFGDDGYLYISFGDGGSGGDPSNRAQNRSVLFGKILRIDVDVPIDDSTYQVPPDNPFVNNTQGWKKEIYAYGLRNPWKITKDPDGSTIWIGDVGQNYMEEIDTLRKGANYGWKVLEGTSAYSACGSCDTSNLEKPIWTYLRNLGYSVTGGFVYRGTEMPPMKGSYIYGDYGSARLTFLKKDETGKYVGAPLVNSTQGISSLGLDSRKEIYVMGYNSAAGKLWKIRCALPTPVVVSPAVTSVCIGDSVVLLAPTTGNPGGYLWSTGDTTRRIVIRNPGTYFPSVKTRSALGCYSYSSNAIKVKISIPPTAPIIPNVSFCQGDSTLVDLPSGLFYKWSDGSSGSGFHVSQTGDYWVIATDSVGCKSDTGKFEATSFPLPPTPGIAQTGPNTLKADSTAEASYVWFLDGNLLTTTNSPGLAINQSGVYSVMVVSAQGCKSDTSAPFSATVLVSAKPQLGGVIQVSPNPFRDKIELRLDGSVAKGGQVEIFTGDGRKLMVVPLEEGRAVTEITTYDLPKGTYVLKVSSGTAKKTFRLVKE